VSQASQPKPSIEELLRQVRENRAGAWTELFRRSRPALRRWARYRLGSTPPAGARPSDVTQDAELGAYQEFKRFTGSSAGEWKKWLKRILVSRFEDMRRKAESQKRNESGHLHLDAPEAQHQPASQRSPSQFTAHQEEWRRLLTHLSQLPDAQGEALSLYHLEELSFAAIAERMGKSQTAVESLIQRGVRTLRDRMTEQRSEEPSGATSDDAIARNAADAALLVYLRKRQAGEPVDPETFAHGHPLCAEDLRSLLHWMEKLHALRPTS